MISAVDLLKGIAICTGMRVIDVPGATGVLDTNYEGKAQAAITSLLELGDDFVYVHLEAPDEMGHQGSAEKKVKSIEYLDQRLISPIVQALDASGEPYRLLILPDHPTAVSLRAHTSEPVPYLLYDSSQARSGPAEYSEETGKQSEILIPNGHRILNKLLNTGG